jgi:hypothetical protein
MAPVPDTLLSLLPRHLFQRSEPSINDDLSSYSPIAIQSLHRRADKDPFTHGSGAVPASSFNNQGFFALFALIGAGMVLTSIWFFFWAKNGGFKWRKGDWDDYKSTVLRRKGPDGRTLSNATKSTKLGGGSVVHGGSYGRSDATSSVGYTDSTGYTDKEEMREVDVHAGNGIRGGGGRGFGRKKERARDPELAEYREEKAARVGGINRQHDGHYFDYSNTEPSEPGATPNKVEKKKRAQAEKDRKAKEKAQAAAHKKAQANAKAVEKAMAAEKKRQDKTAKKDARKTGKKEDKSSGVAKPAPVVLAEPQQPAARSSNNGTPVYAHQHEYQQPASTPRRSQPSAAYSFEEEDDQTVYTGLYSNPYTDYPASHHHQAPSQSGSYYDAYRPKHENNSNRRSAPNSRSNSPRKPRIVSNASEADSDTGTKVYPCYIPGLSSAPSVGVSESVSQVGTRRENRSTGGYRRGGRGRRDSLSDSEGER